MTYREGKVFVYKADSLEQVDVLDMPEQMSEGWGLTNDGEFLYASDGTDTIFKLDPVNFRVVSTVKVKLSASGEAIRYINELEYVKGGSGRFLYANVLPQTIIIQIDLQTGLVSKVWDFQKLLNI